MSSVTKRITEIKQPHGGYLRPSLMSSTQIEDGVTLAPIENIHHTVVGLSVEYLTRFMMTHSVETAFRISLSGAVSAYMLGQKDAIHEAEYYLSLIRNLDDDSIIGACKLTTFDVWARAPLNAFFAKKAVDTNPNEQTINNIRIMVCRSLDFWKQYGPIKNIGFTFEPNGYTDTVTCGDADFLTYDTLWDFKVSKNKISSQNTLQLVMYWIMGKHSGNPQFNGVNNIGIFNPRLNMVSTYDMRTMPEAVLHEIEREVIGYK